MDVHAPCAEGAQMHVRRSKVIPLLSPDCNLKENHGESADQDARVAKGIQCKLRPQVNRDGANDNE